MAKENDLFLNQMENLQFNAFDFSRVGLNADNTSLESKDTYKNLDYIKNNPLFQTNGAFDETKFDSVYDLALLNYNQMANNEVGDQIGQQHHASFYRNDIYAPLSQRRKGYDTQIERTPNPLKSYKGFGASVDSIIENKLSLREIVQTQKVWDFKTNKWIDSPNETGLFKNFGQTLVLAQWDDEGDHIDPVTGEKVHHKKGDKKLNSEGTYYYETLGNRSAYGREVLSKWDTITTDGSVFNKFDPFDSDDKDPNILGAIVRNAIKIAPAFIPVISPWYLGARVAMNIADLMATAGRMIDEDNAISNNVNAYVESLGYSASDYSREHPWALENIINMSADVFTQLQEQRWMFKYPPALFHGNAGMSAENQGKFFAEKLKEASNKTSEEINKLIKSGKRIDLTAVSAEMPVLNQLYASQQVAKYMDDYQKIGKALSIGYMTGITVKDSYGEAIEEGASKWEAALLTLGYALGEYAIISSDLGKWILPELRTEQNRWRQIAKNLANEGLDSDAITRTQDTGKVVNWAKRILHIGKSKALWDYDKNKKGVLALTGKAMIANALGEGVEETSEELLYDFTKTLYNFGYKLTGSDTHLTTFNDGNAKDLFNRYALSFVGGVIGGGLGEATQDFKQATAIANMDKEKAFEQLVQVVKEGNADKFLKTVDKTIWASTRLSTVPAETEYTRFGEVKQPKNSEEVIFLPADKNHPSQNDVAKQNIHKVVDLIKNILDAEGANISNESLLSSITSIDDPLKEFRAVALGHSLFAKDFIKDYNINVEALAKDRAALIGMDREIAEAPDSQKKQLSQDPTKLQERSALEQRIKEEEKILEDYKNGVKANELTKKIIFETSIPLREAFENAKLTLPAFLEYTYRKPLSQLTQAEIQQGTKSFNEFYQEGEGTTLLNKLYDIFTEVNEKASNTIKTFAQTYFDPNSVLGKFKEYTFQQTVLTQNQPTDDAAVKGYENRYQEKYASMMQFLKSMSSLGKLSISWDNLDQMLHDPNLDDNQKESQIITVLLDSFKNDLQNGKQLLQEIKNSNYITAAVKKDLQHTLSAMQDMLFYQDPFDPDNMVSYDINVSNYITELSKELDKVNYSPIAEFLDKFSVATKVESVSISKLIEDLDDYFYNSGKSGTLKEIGYNSEDTENQIKNALSIIKLAKACIQAARTDNASATDLFGYNKTINGLDPKSNVNPNAKLAEIDANVADTMYQEIEQIESRLTYYKTLVDINSNNRISKFSRTGVKSNTLLFDKIVTRFNLPNFPPGDDQTAQELKQTLNDPNNFKILRRLQGNFQTNSNNWSLNDNEKEAYQNEIKQLFDSLHTFFSKNSAMLADPTQLAEFLNPDTSGIDQLDTNLLNINAENISESGFMWILAATAAMDPSKYMALYQSTLKDGELIPVVGQEIGAMVSYAFLLNNKVFENFGKAWNIALSKFAQGKKEIRTIPENFFGSDSDVSINFLHTILNEGIAGSGKSKGIAKTLIKLIKANPNTTHLLDNVWFVHTSEQKAKEFADLLGIQTDKVFSHTSLMKKISGVNPQTGHIWNEVIDSDGNLQIDSEDLIYEDGKPISYNYGLNTTEKPTLIITDEISHMSVPSLLLVDQFVEQAGCVHLTFGDFDQSGINHKLDNAKIKKADGSEMFIPTYYGQANNTNFIHAPKLGESLRTDNKFKDFDNMVFQEELKKSFQTDTPHLVTFKYSETPEHGLLGDKLIDIPLKGDEVSWQQDFENQVRALLDRTIQLGNNKKLGYIYDINDTGNNTDTVNLVHDVMKKLSQEDKYRDIIDFKEGFSAQGDENPYYIINLGKNPDNNKKQFLKDLYTGLTRAERGTLIIGYEGIKKFIKKSVLDNSSKDSPITDAVKSKFISDKQQLYEKVYGNPNQNDLPFVGNKPLKPTPTPPPSTQPSPLPIGTLITDGNNDYEIISFDSNKQELTVKNINDNNDIKIIKVSELSNWQQVTKSDSSQQVEDLNSVNLNPDVLVDNRGLDTQMIHHSYNIDEYGLSKDDTQYGEWADVRLDNAIGLAKILGLDITKPIRSQTAEKLKQTLRIIRSASRLATSEQEIISIIENAISLNLKHGFKFPDNVSVRFFYKVSQRPEVWETNPNYKGNSPSRKFLGNFVKGRYYKPKSETVPRWINDTEMHQQMNDATISMMLIDQSGNELFETPVATDTNPLTLAFSNGFEQIADWITNRREELIKLAPNTDGLYMQLLGELKTELTTGSLKNHPQAKKLLRQINMFIATHDLPMGGQVKFLNNSIGKPLIPGRDWENSGLTLRLSESGTIINVDDFVEYTGETVSHSTLLKSGLFRISNNAYIAPNDITIQQKNRTVTIKAGHPFIIVTDNLFEFTEQTSDEALWDALINGQNRTDLSIVYIEPPAKSFAEYIKHIDSIYNKEVSEIYDKSLGTTTTSFRIIEQLFKSDEGKQFIKNRLKIFDNVNSDAIFNELEQLVQQLSNITVTNTGVDNELVIKLGEYAFDSLQASVGLLNIKQGKTRYINVFDKLTRLLSLGTINNFAIEYENPDPNLPNVQKMEQLLKDGSFKHGFYTRIAYSHEGESEDIIGTQSNRIIKAKLNTDDIKIRGTLCTSAFITKDFSPIRKEASVYEQQKELARTSGKTSLLDSSLYEGRQAGNLLPVINPQQKINTIDVYEKDNNVKFSKYIREKKLDPTTDVSSQLSNLSYRQIKIGNINYIVDEDEIRDAMVDASITDLSNYDIEINPNTFEIKFRPKKGFTGTGVSQINLIKLRNILNSKYQGETVKDILANILNTTPDEIDNLINNNTIKDFVNSVLTQDVYGNVEADLNDLKDAISDSEFKQYLEYLIGENQENPYCSI